MQCFQGKSVYKGIAMGPIVVLKKNDYQVKRTRIEDTEAEVKRVDEALKASQEQLQKLYDKAVREVGEASAAIFEVHQMMLEDEDYLEAIQNMIAMTAVAEKENAAETLLQARGFADPVVSLTDGKVDVVIHAPSITDQQRAQIEDIVKRKTEVGAENIIITLLNLED